ncbi:MAG: glycosyltransferase family 4 protein [Desulfobacterales bacterium]|nr:glycosyltransferase family 4 protein [Desulfobacterales bacterium]
MRVLQVNKFFHLKGGSEAYLFALIDELSKRDVSTAEFSMRHSRNRPSKWSEFFVDPIDYDVTDWRRKLAFGAKIIYSLEAKKKISRLLDDFKPDLVHLHLFQHQISPSILPEIKKRGLPVVYTAHDLKSVCPNYKMRTRGRVCERCKPRRYYHCLFNKCVKDSYLKSMLNTVEMYAHLVMKYYDAIDLFITPSRFYHDKLIEFRFDAGKVVHVPNFVDETAFAPKYSHEGYFIYLGRLSEEKGILTLVEAMREVPGGELRIIGTGPLESEIREKIAAHGLKNVRLLGFRSGDDLKKLIRDCMFSVIPSEWYENGSISLLESLAYGKPVVGADIGGIPEHLTHGEDGLVFRSRDPGDLSEKINWMLENSDQLVRMGKNARKRVDGIYSQESHVDKIIELYESVLNGRGAF